MIYGVGCTNGFNMDVLCIFPNSMDYRKFHLWSWRVGWVGYASKWDYGSIFGALQVKCWIFNEFHHWVITSILSQDKGM